MSVSDADGPNEAHFDEESSRLDRGLKSCRAVVTGYRALLVSEPGPAIADQEIFSCNDRQEGILGQD